MNTRRSISVGIVCGIIFAVVIVGLAKINDLSDGSEVLREIINFVVAPPTVIFAALKMPSIVQNISFFIYWALAGGVWGWLLGQKKVSFKIITFVFLTGGIILHHLANVKMSREITEALRAFGQWLTGGLR